MLDLRPGCECCDRDLPPDSALAMICTYECTFCAPCVKDVLKNKCPNCGGGFMPRPMRSPHMLLKHPATTQRTFHPEKCRAA